MIPVWIVWALVADLLWGIWAVLSKFTEAQYNGIPLDGLQCQALSTLGALPVILGLACVRGPSDPGNKRRGIAWSFVGGIISCLGNVFFFHALQRGPAAIVVPLTAMYPLVTVLLAITLLRDRLNFWQGLGIACSLGAIYLFNAMGTTDANRVHTWLPAAGLAAILFGLAGLLQKIATNDISGQRSAAWFLWGFFPVAPLLLFLSPLPAHIGSWNWLLTFLIGFTLAAGNLAILLAFASGGKASIITPLAGLYPIVSVPITVFVLKEPINGRIWSAIIISLVAVVLLAYERSPEEKEKELPSWEARSNI